MTSTIQVFSTTFHLIPPNKKEDERQCPSDPRVVMWPSRKIPEICQWLLLPGHLDQQEGGGGEGGEQEDGWRPPSSSSRRPPSSCHRLHWWQAGRSSHQKSPSSELMKKLRQLNIPFPIVAKKWEPRNPVPSRFSAQIRKVEARLGKLAKIRKVETN